MTLIASRCDFARGRGGQLPHPNVEKRDVKMGHPRDFCLNQRFCPLDALERATRHSPHSTRSGGPPGQIIGEFPDLTPEQIAACLGYARELAEFEAVV